MPTLDRALQDVRNQRDARVQDIQELLGAELRVCRQVIAEVAAADRLLGTPDLPDALRQALLRARRVDEELRR